MNDVLIAVSTKSDGTMLDKSLGLHAPEIVARRRDFCAAHGVDYATQVTYLRVTYGDTRSYDVICDVDQAVQEIAADALYTEVSSLGLFLPVADCIATVIYDPVRRALMLAHIGRHASVADLATKSVQYFVSRGSNPADLCVYMAPHVASNSYHLEYFDHAKSPLWEPYCDVRADGIYLDMAGYNRARLIAASVTPTNIESSTIDTATHPDYFSHSQGDTTGRFAILAMIR